MVGTDGADTAHDVKFVVINDRTSSHTADDFRCIDFGPASTVGRGKYLVVSSRVGCGVTRGKGIEFAVEECYRVIVHVRRNTSCAYVGADLFTGCQVVFGIGDDYRKGIVFGLSFIRGGEHDRIVQVECFSRNSSTVYGNRCIHRRTYGKSASFQFRRLGHHGNGTLDCQCRLVDNSGVGSSFRSSNGYTGDTESRVIVIVAARCETEYGAKGHKQHRVKFFHT